jgi:hypothetical protein
MFIISKENIKEILYYYSDGIEPYAISNEMPSDHIHIKGQYEFSYVHLEHKECIVNELTGNKSNILPTTIEISISPRKEIAQMEGEIYYHKKDSEHHLPENIFVEIHLNQDRFDTLSSMLQNKSKSIVGITVDVSLQAAQPAKSKYELPYVIVEGFHFKFQFSHQE